MSERLCIVLRLRYEDYVEGFSDSIFKAGETIMKIGVDYSGTITAAPDFFRAFACAMITAGHDIYIISAYPNSHGIEAYLRRFQIPCTNIVTPEDSLVSISEWKSEICESLNLTALIDDDPSNLTGLSSRIMRFSLRVE